MRIEVPARRPAGIRLTPLIDVVFILLVFFMLASSFLDWRGLDVGLPPADATPDPEVDPVVVMIAADGTLTVAGERVTDDALAARVRALRHDDPGRPVVVHPAAKTPVQATVDVVDRLRGAGIEALSLAAGAS